MYLGDLPASGWYTLFLAVPLNYIIKIKLSRLVGAWNYWYNLEMKTKLFIDFDGTLFNTEAFKEKLYAIFVMAGFEPEEIESTYKAECLDYLYSPLDQMERLLKIHEFNIEMAKVRLKKLIDTASSFLFSDDISYIKNIDHNIFELSLLTLGDIDFQKQKVQHSGIEKYFDHIYYCERQKWDFLDSLAKADEKFIIIDDRPDTLKEIGKKFKRSFPILMTRPEHDNDDPILAQHNDFSGISVKNMKQAVSYL